ncbi:RNA polymerase sigma-54 factor (sigma-N) [Salmonella enterica subsp. enterica]|uniref:RNA polymerase sigma-54 factor n=1 Tax=Salmonella enterica I TaxID=59201 RepID=A0A379WKN5_SALET|nr:RNA polymerase sigma-54 factor (sigma-N) [Salmonella enterica subsp. enterica]
MPEELPLDASWDEIYTAGTPSGPSGDYIDDELPVYQGETTQSLQDYLMWQVELTPFSDTDRAIATSIVDAVDDTGYLTVSLDEIRESMGDVEVDLDEVEAVLKRIQRFDPVGVAAKDLRDCLLIQLSQFDKSTPWLEEARLIICDHLDLLGQPRFPHVDARYPTKRRGAERGGKPDSVARSQTRSIDPDRRAGVRYPGCAGTQA